MSGIGRFLGFVWSFPVSLLARLVFSFFVLFKQLKKPSKLEGFITLWVVKPNSWLSWKMSGWYGFTVGSHIVVVDVLSKHKKNLEHEKVHVQQNFIFGITFYPVYIIMSLVLFFFTKLHPYFDNPFERWARRSAGQEVDVETSGKDRWLWW
jgi:hypothetical protein